MNPGLGIRSAHSSALAAAVRLASSDVAVVGSSIPSPQSGARGLCARGFLEARWYLLHGFDGSPGHGDQPEEGRALLKQFQRRKIRRRACSIEMASTAAHQAPGQLKVGGGVSLENVLVWLIEVARIPIAEVSTA